MKIDVTEDFNKDAAYYTGVSTSSFRPKEQAKIVGVVIVTPEGKEPRECYKVEYNDGFIDYKAIVDTSNYIISKKKKEMIEIDGVEYEKEEIKRLLNNRCGAKTLVPPNKEHVIAYGAEEDCLYSIVHCDTIKTQLYHPSTFDKNFLLHGRYRKTKENAEYTLKRNQRGNLLEALVEDLQGELGVGVYCDVRYKDEHYWQKMKPKTHNKVCELLNSGQYSLEE